MNAVAHGASRPVWIASSPNSFIVRRIDGMAASVEDAVTDGKDSPRFPAPRFRNCAILSAMSASPQPHRIPVEEYLSTSYRPDRDYVDGEKDRLSRILERNADYFHFGTEHVWLVDPEERRGYVCNRGGLQEQESGILKIPGTPILVVLSELFAELDRA